MLIGDIILDKNTQSFKLTYNNKKIYIKEEEVIIKVKEILSKDREDNLESYLANLIDFKDGPYYTDLIEFFTIFYTDNIEWTINWIGDMGFLREVIWE
jgi:hypothetical protein